MSARRGMISGLTLAATVIALTAAGSTVQALNSGAGRINRVVVKYSDLNLHTEKDTKKLLRRIRRAAHRVCGGYNGTPHAYANRNTRSYRKCVTESRERAVNMLAANLSARAKTATTVRDYSKAEDLYRRALMLSQVLERRTDMAEHLRKLSVIAMTQGDLGMAAECHERAFAINMELGRKEDAAGDLGMLGAIARQRGDLNTAETHYRRALALNAELNHAPGMANQIRNLGLIAWKRGDLDSAEALHRSALALHQDLDEKEEVARSLTNLGQIAHSRGDFKLAGEYHSRALAINADLGRKRQAAIQHANLWTLALEQRRLEEAELHLLQALKLSREAGMPEETAALAQTQMGLIRLARGNKTDACAAWDSARNTYNEIGNGAEAARVEDIMKKSLCGEEKGRHPVTAALQ